MKRKIGTRTAKTLKGLITPVSHTVSNVEKEICLLVNFIMFAFHSGVTVLGTRGKLLEYFSLC